MMNTAALVYRLRNIPNNTECRGAANYIEGLERQLAEAHKTATHDKGMFEVRLGSARTKTEIERAARQQAEAEAAVLREALDDAVRVVGSAHARHVGDHMSHIAHVETDRVERWRQTLATAPERAKLLLDVVKAARHFREVWGIENAHVVIDAHTKLRLAFKALDALDAKGGGA